MRSEPFRRKTRRRVGVGYDCRVGGKTGVGCSGRVSSGKHGEKRRRTMGLATRRSGAIVYFRVVGRRQSGAVDPGGAVVAKIDDATKQLRLRPAHGGLAGGKLGGGAPKFGTGYGFAGSGSAIPEGLLTVTTENKIIFDLNGHVVDRNIGEGQSGGVFYVPGTLIICDSDPTAAHYKDKDGGDGIENAKYTYELSQPGNVSDTVKQAVYGGMITGGKTNGSSQWGDSLGGGIRVYGTGTLRMFGGTVYGNYSNLQGGGIYGSTNATNISLMEIDGGNVIGNSCGETDNTDTRGGGIFSNGTLKIVSGNVLANSSRSGAGVCLGASGSMEMSGGMISYNRGFGYNSQGGGIYSESGKIAMTGGKVLYNGNVGYGGGG